MRTDQELLDLKEEDYFLLTDEELAKLEELQNKTEDGNKDKDVDDLKKGDGDKDAKGNKGDKDGDNKGVDDDKKSEYEILLETKKWDNNGLAKGYSEIEKHSSKVSAENAELKKKMETKEMEDKIKKELEEKNVDPLKLKEETDAKASQLVLDLADAEKAPQIFSNVIDIAKQAAIEEMKKGDLKGLLEEKEKRDEERLNETVLGQVTKAIETIAEKYYEGDKTKAEIHFKKIEPKINEIYEEYSEKFKKGLTTIDLKTEPGSLNMVLAEALLATGMPKKNITTIDTGQKKKGEVKVPLTSVKFSQMSEEEKKNLSDEDIDAAIAAEKAGK